MKLLHAVFYTVDGHLIEWYADYDLNYRLATWEANRRNSHIVYSKSVYESDNGTEEISVYRNTNHDVIAKEIAEAMLYILK